MALCRRMASTCVIRSLSHTQSGRISSGSEAMIRICLAAATFSKVSHALRTRVSSWVAAGLISRCPVSQLSSVSMSPRSLDVRRDSFLMVDNSGEPPLVSPASAHDRITASGVRSSWEAAAMNWFCRSLFASMGSSSFPVKIHAKLQMAMSASVMIPRNKTRCLVICSWRSFRGAASRTSSVAWFFSIVTTKQ